MRLDNNFAYILSFQCWKIAQYAMKVTGLICLLLMANTLFAQQIVPGTWSNRTGPGGSVSDPPTGGESSYFDMTSWDSSPFQEFRLHQGSDTPNGANFWLNFRLLFPQPYNQQPSEKYPLIVMLHGLGEAGIRGTANFPAYSASDPRYLSNDHSLYHGGFPHLEAVTEGTFPGFVLVPQNSVIWNDDQTDGVIAIIEELLKTYPIDEYRIYLHGYSNGADGVWQIAEKRPDLFAAMLPMSWINLEVDRSQFIHIPTWYFQGELDGNPLASTAQFMMSLLESEGGVPRYTEYENAGHAIWDRAYAEPDFFSWMLGYNKTDIMAYFGRTTVCPDEEVNIRLGVSPGFQSYQWRLTTEAGQETFQPGGPGANELIAQETGDYQVRVSRSSSPGSNDWSPWSKPLSITVQDDIISPDISIDGSPHLPSPDGRTSAQLSIPDEYIAYQWYRDGNPILESGSTQPSYETAVQGDYHVAVSLAQTCPAISSDTVRITYNAPTNSINAPSNLTAQAVSEVAIALDWQDGANNEDGFEVYRAPATNGPYSLIKNLPQNTVYQKDSSLVPSTTYFYRIRAFNENGPSALSNRASATTLSDTIPPSTPGLLTYELTDIRNVTLRWGASTDNSDLIIYDIIVNGQVVASTTDLNYSLNNLNQNQLYTMHVRARDRAGNISLLSNQVSVITVFEGLSYKYYYGGLWAQIADYDGWPVEKQGYMEDIDISREVEGGVRPDPQVNYFAFDFEGYLYIEKAGRYIFSLEAAAGSILQVGGFILDNDGQHPATTEIGSTRLRKGPVKLVVRYYDRTEEEVLNIRYSGPDTNDELIEIPPDAFTSSLKTFPDPPLAPTDFTATDPKIRQVDLSWVDQSDNESGFEILRATSETGPYSNITTATVNQTSVTDASLSPLTTYHFIVRAVGATGTSEFDSLSMTSGLPLAALNVSCESSGNVINWTNSYPWLEEPYLLERSQDKETAMVIGQVRADSLGKTFTWIDNAYSSDTTFYRIGQKSPGGGIGYSDWISAPCLPVSFQLLADVYPVPVRNGYLTIRMRTMLPNQPLTIVLMDNIGRIHLETIVEPDPMASPYSLDLSNISGKGLYILSIRQGGESFQQKIIIEN